MYDVYVYLTVYNWKLSLSITDVAVTAFLGHWLLLKPLRQNEYCSLSWWYYSWAVKSCATISLVCYYKANYYDTVLCFLLIFTIKSSCISTSTTSCLSMYIYTFILILLSPITSPSTSICTSTCTSNNRLF